MRFQLKGKYLLIAAIAVALASCKASGDDTGLEYAPQMYHSIPYEPLTQIKDKSEGDWLSSDDDEVGEFYNSNPNNPHSMTMRVPAPNTVPRNAHATVAVGSTEGFDQALELPYRVHKDSLELAGRLITNPYDSTNAILADGKVLYERFCDHCHGQKGLGADEGSVGEVYQGVPAYNSAAVVNATEGRIYHVITHGKGLMGAHGSQISPEDRWKIVRYVQVLQKQD